MDGKATTYLQMLIGLPCSNRNYVTHSKLGQIGTSAVVTCQAVIQLAKRVHVVNDHPVTLGDARFD